MAQDIRARSTTPEDWQALRDLRLAALRDAPDAYGLRLFEVENDPDDDWRRRARENAEWPDRASFLVEVGDQACGLAYCRVVASAPHSCEIGAMWVQPTARRLGCAQALLASALEWSVTAGAARVQLWVTVGNLAALRFYKAHGFVETLAKQPLRPDSPLELVLMVRKLETSSS